MIHVGQILFDARVKKGLSLEEVSKAIKIKPSFLSAIEKGEYKKLPSSAYASGFVRNYIQFLGLPEKQTIALFRREFDEEKIYKVLPEGLTKQEKFSGSKLRIGQTAIVVFLLFVSLIGYILFQNRYSFLNPPLDVTTPKEGATFSSQSVLVSGKTDSNATVYINQTAVFLENNGEFKKNVDVFPGKTTLLIRAVNRFGKETKVERHIEVK